MAGVPPPKGLGYGEDRASGYGVLRPFWMTDDGKQPPAVITPKRVHYGVFCRAIIAAVNGITNAQLPSGTGHKRVPVRGKGGSGGSTAPV